MTYKKYIEIMKKNNNLYIVNCSMNSKYQILHPGAILIHFIIVLSLLFNCSIKRNMCFLTKTFKISILLTTYIVLALRRGTNFSIRR